MKKNMWQRIGVLFGIFVCVLFGYHCIDVQANEPDEIVDEQQVETQTTEHNIVDMPEETDLTDNVAESEVPTIVEPSVDYQTHVENIGWQPDKTDGQIAGTTGQSKRVEALKIHLSDSSYEGGVEYRTHIQNIGWTNWVKDGTVSGTTGKSLRAEALQIRLTGEIAQAYSVYYRVHIQSYGWLAWTCDGGYAGSEMLSKRIEALQIELIKKEDKAPDTIGESMIYPVIGYQSHVQMIGWQGRKMDGELSGTTGQSKRVEAIKISFYKTPEYSGNILYRTHVQSYGWMDWKKNGQLSGTTGQGKRIEALQIKLDGEMARHYDVYYRTHIEGFGWLEWASDGEVSGSSGMSRRVEAYEIKLVKKGQTAPSTVNTVSYMDRYWAYNTAGTKVSGEQWINFKKFKIYLHNQDVSKYDRHHEKHQAWFLYPLAYARMRDYVVGRSYDIDKAYGAQCWDFVAHVMGKYYNGKPISCNSSGYVKDIAYNKKTNGILTFTTDKTNINRMQMQAGDIIIWGVGRVTKLSHIALLDHYEGNTMYIIGQNHKGLQRVNCISLPTYDIIGIFRPKKITNLP
ncbi:MAG: Ig domain-containing protein [Erysipelotrichaceae bacterium]|nr:Ig domain-containing protein [Erysipelotrichaceae bacterium]